MCMVTVNSARCAACTAITQVAAAASGICPPSSSTPSSTYTAPVASPVITEPTLVLVVTRRARASCTSVSAPITRSYWSSRSPTSKATSVPGAAAGLG